MTVREQEWFCAFHGTLFTAPKPKWAYPDCPTCGRSVNVWLASFARKKNWLPSERMKGAI